MLYFYDHNKLPLETTNLHLDCNCLSCSNYRTGNQLQVPEFSSRRSNVKA